MRWWSRFILTLVLAPPLFWAVLLYIGVRQGGDIGGWSAVFRGLGEIYEIYTIPAIILVVLVLLPIDALLQRLGLALLTFIVSPLIGFFVALLILTFVKEPHVQAAAGALGLFAAYGLVWGWSIREPRFGGAALPESADRAAA